MRLLILAYDFPPNGSIGGQRPYSWFKYLKEFGIHPVVVTRHWDTVVTPEDTIRPCGSEVSITESEEGTLIRVPFRPNLRDRMLLRFGDRFSFIRKVLSLWFTLAQYFIPWVDNRRNIHEAAREYLKSHPCDALIATGEPFILFRYAQLLSSEFSIPWVADYRDGWSTNYHAENGGAMDRLINRHFLNPLERQLLGSCAQVTVAAPAMQSELNALDAKARIDIVYNGYFHELFENLPIAERPPHRPFTIVHSGTLYPYQKAQLFLEGLYRFIDKHALSPADLKVVFLGLNYQPQQVDRVMNAHASLRPFIQTTDRMSHREALQQLVEADVLLLLANRDYGQIYAKVFDYIALQKPVLMCEHDHGPIASILTDSGTGIFTETADEVAEKLGLLMNGGLQVTANSARIQRFSRRHQTSILADLLKDPVNQ